MGKSFNSYWFYRFVCSNYERTAANVFRIQSDMTIHQYGRNLYGCKLMNFNDFTGSPNFQAGPYCVLVESMYELNEILETSRLKAFSIIRCACVMLR